ncbi:hypothetical protein C8R46DRAFT_1213397 [Mycena filopes]|nr:hypothetical protein C8R46DRAFT_1213397 [Mycena filopes]
MAKQAHLFPDLHACHSSPPPPLCPSSNIPLSTTSPSHLSVLALHASPATPLSLFPPALDSLWRSPRGAYRFFPPAKRLASPASKQLQENRRIAVGRKGAKTPPAPSPRCAAIPLLPAAHVHLLIIIPALFPMIPHLPRYIQAPLLRCLTTPPTPPHGPTLPAPLLRSFYDLCPLGRQILLALIRNPPPLLFPTPFTSANCDACACA